MSLHNRMPEQEEIEHFERLARKALAAYGLEDARLGYLGRAKNAVFEVSATSHAGEPFDRHYALRISPRGWSREQLLRELLLLTSLRRDTDLRVPEPVLARSGDLLRSVSILGVSGFRLVALLRWVNGEPAASKSLAPELAHGIGRLLGRLHQHAGAFRWPAELELPRRDAERLETAIDPKQLAKRTDPERADVFAKAVGQIRQSMMALGSSPKATGVIHSDLRLRNLLLHEGEIGAIGFGECRWGYYLYDLATVCLAFRKMENYDGLRAALLTGYQEAHLLLEEHEEHLGRFTALRLLDELTHDLRTAPSHTTADVPKRVQQSVERLQRIVETHT